MKLLVFDTETTGRIDKKRPKTAPEQPRLVQMGAQLIDTKARTPLQEFNLIARPDAGVFISSGAESCHGLSTEYTQQVGIPAKAILVLFNELVRAADCVCVYNLEFDETIILSEYARQRSPYFREAGEFWRQTEKFCLMRAMTPICAIPKASGGFKWPKLKEAYRHFFGVSFDNAHDAFADTRASVAVFYEWQKTQNGQAVMNRIERDLGRDRSPEPFPVLKAA